MTEFSNYEHLYLSLTINTLKNSGYWCFSYDKMATPRRRYLDSIAEVNIHRLTSYRGTEKRPDNLGRIQNHAPLHARLKISFKAWPGCEDP